MSPEAPPPRPGEPDLKVAGLQLWVHGRQFPESDDGDDGNSASLDPFEPELKVSLEFADALGHIRAKVEITPDHLAQAHLFEFEVDPSHFTSIIRQCSANVAGYPVGGRQDDSGPTLPPPCIGDVLDRVAARPSSISIPPVWATGLARVGPELAASSQE